ncbi:hypothetical protein VPH35_126650 [Triticum aestivum]
MQVPSVGTIFDSKDEAYDFYNMFSWEGGFGICYGKSSTNSKNYRTMQDIVCRCAICIILNLIVCMVSVGLVVHTSFSAYDSVSLPLSQGKEERPNTTTFRTHCEARIRLHRTDDHGWYVTVFINKHNHPLSVKCGEKKQ